nr:hypothetical protein [Tanacetum cinerariifolium]
MNGIGPLWDDIADWIKSLSSKGSVVSIVATLVLAATTYYIWQERNLRLFKNQSRSIAQVCDIIVYNVRLKMLTYRFKKSKKVEQFLEKWNIRVDEANTMICPPSNNNNCWSGGIPSLYSIKVLSLLMVSELLTSKLFKVFPVDKAFTVIFIRPLFITKRLEWSPCEHCSALGVRVSDLQTDCSSISSGDEDLHRPAPFSKVKTMGGPMMDLALEKCKVIIEQLTFNVQHLQLQGNTIFILDLGFHHADGVRAFNL